jgi:hypothetical protein
MRFILKFFFITILLTGSLYAQQSEYPRFVVDVLASDSLFGRGFVNNGDKKAAVFIRDQFIEFDVEPAGDSYFQTFTIPVNTFPDSIYLSIDSQHFEVGKDFHVLPGSSTLNGEFDIQFIKQDEIFNPTVLQGKIAESAGKIIVLDAYPDSLLDQAKRNQLNQIQQFLTRHPNNPAAGTILLTSDKLTWYGAQYEDAISSFQLKKELFNPESKKISIQLNNEFIEEYQTQNVLGLIEGNNPDSVIVIMAHYDHFGMMGQAIFPGANDNASGVAMLLSLAKYHSENKPEYSLLFAAFGAEELGLIGSKYFVDRPPIDLSRINFVLNFDISGTGDEGIQVVNGSVHRDEFDRLVELNNQHDLLPEVKIRGAACNSDHCNFNRIGIPGFYMYTLGGIQAYHDIFDRAETLPLTEFEDYFKLMTLFIDSLKP